MAIYPFRYWCYKILPLVYDDSLSYYEVLCKLCAKLNEVIEMVNTAPDNVAEIVTNIMTEWKNDGTLDDIIEPEVEAAVATILNDWKNDGTLENLITEDLDTIVNQILNQWVTDGTIKNLLKHIHADNHYVVNVAGTSGDDANDGSSEHPIKTLDHAFEMMAEYGAGIYINFIEGGTYTLSKKTIHAASVHMTTDKDITSPVTIRWNIDRNETNKFYASYLHISGREDYPLTLIGNGSENGFEPGKIYSNYVIFRCESAGGYFAVYGGSAQLRHSTFRCPWRFGGSNAIIDNCTMNPEIDKIGNEYTRMIQAYNGSTVTFVGETTFTPKSNYGTMTSWMSFSRCSVFIHDDATFTINNADASIPLFGGGWNNFTGQFSVIYPLIANNNNSLDYTVFNGVYSSGNDVIPHLQYQTGSFSQSVSAGSYEDKAITFQYPYESAPNVWTQIISGVSDVDMTDIVATIVSGSNTGTGFTVRVINGSDSTRTPTIRWFAMHG